jgi:hypothetical protein
MESISGLFVVVVEKSFGESFQKRESVGDEKFQWFSVFFEEELVVFDETLQTEETTENFVELLGRLETLKNCGEDGLPVSGEVVASDVENDDFDLFA